MPRLYLESLLGDQERIMVTARQHWFMLAWSVALETLVILGILAGLIFAAVSNPVWGLALFFIGSLFVLIPLASMIHDILVWSNHQFIITNWRVLQIAGIINKSITDSSLEKVNDVKMTQSFFGRIFNFGDIEILTASELGVNKFRCIDDPVRFKTAMINAKEAADRGVTLPPPQADVPTLLAQLAELREKGILTDEEFSQKKAELLARIK